VTLYDLPFSSSPNVTTDAGAAGVSTTSWAQGAFDASYNASIGNFTLVVNGFSGYNATDNIAPVVTINAPTASQNLSSGMVAVNATLNGTGTEISAAYFRVNGTEVAYYNSTGNTAGCAAAASGSEIYNCAFSINLSNGAKSLNVTAYDFGAPAPGNMGSAARAFMVDTVAPVVSIQVPVANSVINVSNTTLNFTVSDALSTLNASSCEYSLNGTRVSLGASCANGTQLNFTSDGVKTLTVFAKDMSGNEGNTTISFLVNTAGSNSTIINTTTNATVNETIYVTPTSPASNITMGANATNVTLNMTAYNSSASFNVTLPEINVTANTSLGNVLVGIPNGTVASGAADWNGVLQLPIVRTGSFTPTAASGYTATAQAAVEIGVSDIAINLSRGVRILIPGKADQLVGFQRPTAGFVAITNVCGADSQAWADANITNGSECKINNGSDMVIWTKHFTMFGTYTQAANGGGSSGGSNNGGGSIIGGSSAPSSTKQASTTNVDVGLGKTCAVTITRSMSSTANLSVLTTTLENIGGAGCSMTDFVFSDTIPADFPALNDVTFNPMYATREGWTVNFSFPTFAAGESKTLSYSANQWIRTSLAKNFTAYTMAAKKQTTTAPSANTTTGPVVEEPSVWVPRPLPPMPTEQPAVQPSAPAQQPASADNSSALLLTALVVLAAAAGVAGVYLYMKGKKQGA
jgi:hypothetical protein